MTPMQRTEGNEGINRTDIWRRAFLAKEITNAKVLMQESGMIEGQQA